MISSMTRSMIALPGFLPVGAPDTAEGTVLGAAANGLHRGPHVFLGVHQVPAGWQELAAFDAPAFVDALGLTGETIVDDSAPGHDRRRP